MTKDCEAIVLRVIKHSDKTDIADLYTDIGRLSVAVPTSKGKKRNNTRLLFRPLAMLRLIIDVKPHASIHRLCEAHTSTPQISLPYNPIKQTIVFFLADFLAHTMREETSDKLLFAYIAKSIEWLDRCESDYANFHLVFLMHISQFLGLRPDTSSYQEGDLFDMENARFCATLPSHGNYLDAKDAHALHALMRMRYNNMRFFKMSRAERNRCLEVIMKYYSIHITDLANMRTPDVLRECFDFLQN